MERDLLQKTLNAAAHPLTAGLLLLLLLNDHLFRRLWPTWWTGKLGDAAWLFFAPLLVLLLLAFAARRMPVRRQRALPLLAYGLVALVYTLGNTWAGFSALLLRVGMSLLRIPLAITVDPTDLLVLPVLPLSYLFWLRGRERKRVRNCSRTWAAGAVLLGLVLTVANTAAPQYGVDGLEIQDGAIIAYATFRSYASEDGGLHWSLTAVDYSQDCGQDWDGSLRVELPGGERVFRYRAEDAVIESSADNGAAWQIEYRLQPASEARRTFYEKQISGNAHYRQGPLDAVYDPQSGSLVLAMGLEGVLVRTQDGAWQPAAVAEFAPREITFFTAFGMLWGEVLLAVGLLFLLLSTAGVRLKPRWFTITPLVLAWMIWILIVALFSPARYESYPLPLEFPFLALGALLLPLTGFTLYWLLKKAVSRSLFAFLIAVGAALLFFLPYLLWGLSVIASYNAAMLLGLIAAAAGFVLVFLFKSGDSGSSS